MCCQRALAWASMFFISSFVAPAGTVKRERAASTLGLLTQESKLETYNGSEGSSPSLKAQRRGTGSSPLSAQR